MKRIAFLSALLILACPTAQAQNLIDQNSVMFQEHALPGVGSDLPEGSLSMESIKIIMKRQGYTKITDLMMSPANGMLQASAINADGILTNLQIDPATGDIVSALASH